MFWTDAVNKLRIAGRSVDSGVYVTGGALLVLMIVLIVALAIL
jgi:hypothetical protein